MSRFGQMHNDYLDPDRHLWPAEDFGNEMSQVLDALKAWDSGRWDYAPVSGDEGITLSGKDGDLERGGAQGIQLVNADEERVYFRVHAGATFAGLDVCLNLRPSDAEDEGLVDAYLDAYLTQAQEVVNGIPFTGYWSGDDWYISMHGEVISVPWELFDNDGRDDLINYAGTAAAIVKAAEGALSGWNSELGMAHDCLDVLAGWKRREDDQVFGPEANLVDVPAKTNADEPLDLIDVEAYYEDLKYRQEVAEAEDLADEPPDQFMSDAEADADALASIGWGTDEDYGHYGDD